MQSNIFKLLHFNFLKQIEAFLNETYPGAKVMPNEMIRLMGSPNLNPDIALAGVVIQCI